jgi:glycosyltransferase involved in cell wall biosynthesis
VVALTSKNEGTPLTLIEAMANARPVVATSVGGVIDLLGEVIEDGPYKVCKRGISVPAGDEEAFVAALSRIIRDRSLRHELGSRGLEFVEVNYSKERLFEDIKGLYEELLNRRRISNCEIAGLNSQFEIHLSKSPQGAETFASTHHRRRWFYRLSFN